GIEVVGIDNINNYYTPELKEWRLKILNKYYNFSFYKEDIENYKALEKIFKKHKFDGVVNLAAQVGVRPSVEKPWKYFNTNTIGTLNLLECCKSYKTEKFILASSSSVYGTDKTPFSEKDFTDKSLSPYASSKKSAEILCHPYHYLYGMHITIARFFTVYGPSGRPDMAIMKFIRNIDKGVPIDIFGDGKQARDFTYVDDIANGLYLSLDLEGYNIVNFGDNKPVELKKIINLIEKSLGKTANINYLPSHPADVLITWADINHTFDLIGWRPDIDIEEGISSTVEWYLQNKELVKKMK
ncbi:GDP-mannose 4,6-dehydratase, partial [Candidatus Latescibacterota bacterium]